MQVCAHIIVKGMVQGVGFRYFVHKRATQIGLTGYAKNLENGNVEVKAEGERSLIEELIKEIKVGPRMSHVSDIFVDWKPFEQNFTEFTIR